MSKAGPYPKGVNGSNYGAIDTIALEAQKLKALRLMTERGKEYLAMLKRIAENHKSSTQPNANSIPIINLESERRDSIMNNTPARFEIADNPSADSSEPFRELDIFDEVDGNEIIFEDVGEEIGIDPDFLKAIAYMETTHGYYDYLGALPGIDVTSFRPMNVRYDKWAKLAKELGYTEDDIRDDFRANVRLGAVILKRIWVRVENPTIRKVASIYNFTGAELVRDYGARVEQIYNEKLWAED